jgi:hypothetical protein
MKRSIPIILAIALSGCATTITNAPVDIKPDGIVANGLRDANFNLQSAIQIGVLPENDPAASCVQGILRDAGLEEGAPAVKSFDPRVSDLISAASVAYIEAQRLKTLRNEAHVPMGCEALLGRIVIDAAKRGARLSPFR